MLTLTIVAGSICATTVLVQVASALVAVLRMRAVPSRVPVPRHAPAVSLIRPVTGLVCSPPVGCLPDGVFAELECAFLNTYQARWQCVADSAGYGFAQGKSMLWRRDLLERAGGIRVLASELAEDAASTKVVR